WLTRDAAVRLAVRSHLPSTERAHFSQYKSAKTLYDAVVARYSSPATAALSRLMLPYLFPDLAAFATVTDLIMHLRTSDTRYCAALPAEDHFLSLCPTTLTVDLLEERLLAAETSITAVGASCGDPRTPFFEGCSPVPLLPSVASAAAVDLVCTESEVVGAAELVVEAEEGVRVEVVVEAGASVVAVEVGAAVAVAGGVEEAEAAAAEVELAEAELCSGDPSSSSALVRPLRPSSFVSGTRGARGLGFLDATEIPRWGDLFRSEVAIFDLDFDAILAAMYAVSISAEGDCYVCVPPDPGIEAAALGASESAAPGTRESAAPESSLPALADSAFDSLRAASPTVTRLLATVVTDPSFESTAASALVTDLVEFAAHCRLDYATSLVAESESVCPPSVGEGPYSSQWQAAMDAEMASWKSTGTYVDKVPPPGANIGSLHEEIWLRRPLGFTGSFPAGTQWSLRRPVYGLRQAPREWHDTLRTTLAALGFAPSTADPSLFLRTDTLLPPFYILVCVDDLVFATADTAGLAHVKSELQKRHTCTDLDEMRSYLGLQITRDRARRTITLTQSHMVQQVLQRFDFTYSSPSATPLSTRHSLSAVPSDESVEPSGPYPELVGCLMYLMTCTRPDLAYPLSILARYVAPGRHRLEHMAAAKRVLRYLCSTSG
ncbi:unnamed protein product, partial [Closterium sp. NIES-54]